MSDELKDKIIQSLIDQKEIFGDDLFQESIPSGEGKILNSRRTEISKDKVSEPGELFGVEKKEWELTDNLDDLNKLICECQECPLGATRNKFVFGSGNPDADVMCIGEGPGADEDAQGLPFVGRAGKLLTDILAAIKFSRDEVYIANVVKCRPPGNRTPLPAEMDTCLPYLKKQIEIIKPKVILCLGRTAAQGILKKRDSLTKMRGQIFDFESGSRRTKVMVTYHPAALLRNPNWKRPCWEDVQNFRKLYDELVAS